MPESPASAGKDKEKAAGKKDTVGKKPARRVPLGDLAPEKPVEAKPDKKSAEPPRKTVREQLQADIAESSSGEALEPNAKSKKGHERPEPAKPESPTETTPPGKEAAPADEGIIPLNDETREVAEGIIDLHEETIESEISLHETESAEIAEAVADAELLENTREYIEEAPAETAMNEAIEQAYAETLADLPEPPAIETGPPASEPIEPPTPERPAAPMPVALAAAEQARQYEQTPPTAEPLAAAAPARLVAPLPEASAKAWYPAKAETPARWYRPATWREKLSRRPATPKTERQETAPLAAAVPESRPVQLPAPELPRPVSQYAPAIERSINRNEQAIRAAMKEQLATVPAVATAEAKPLPAPPKPPEKVPSPAERVQRLGKRELLETSQNIIIDGVSLRGIYEAKLITEPGLRRVVYEYFRGGDIKKSLDEALSAKELVYERDPQMRDRLAASYSAVNSAAPAAAGLQPAANIPAHTSDTQQNNQSASSSSHSNNKTGASSSTRGRSSSQTEQVVTYTWSVIIAVLVIIAVVLLLR